LTSAFPPLSSPFTPPFNRPHGRVGIPSRDSPYFKEEGTPIREIGAFYPTMPLSDLKALPVASTAEREPIDAHLAQLGYGK
jgi:hypothetical protein